MFTEYRFGENRCNHCGITRREAGGLTSNHLCSGCEVKAWKLTIYASNPKNDIIMFVEPDKHNYVYIAIAQALMDDWQAIGIKDNIHLERLVINPEYKGE